MTFSKKWLPSGYCPSASITSRTSTAFTSRLSLPLFSYSVLQGTSPQFLERLHRTSMVDLGSSSLVVASRSWSV
ncbi:hypothetical protein LINPERPRIM_LOCUS19103 [Linum perenne]